MAVFMFLIILIIWGILLDCDKAWYNVHIFHKGYLLRILGAYINHYNEANLHTRKEGSFGLDFVN